MRDAPRDAAESFVADYAEKIFYFCLRRCGGAAEAEDLSQEITLNILSALRRTEPRNLSAYVWRVARNRYARWADAKRRRRESVSGADFDETGEPGALTPEAELVRAEDLRLLRRELAFIASDYREIVVAHYIENRSLEDIARSLSLPSGTVRSKLRRAREKLKEGISMSREFGVMSYKPESVDYIINAGELPSPDGEPFASIWRLLSKNLMLAAYRTPSTAEELAIELGVALPYVEDELRRLAEVTLMRKNGNRYETNHFIVSAAAQERIFEHLKGFAAPLTAKLIEYLDAEERFRDENGYWHEGWQSPEDMRWTRLLRFIDWEVYTEVAWNRREWPHSEDLKISGRTLRPHGAEWDVIGVERFEREGIATGVHCVNDNGVYHYQIVWNGIHEETRGFLCSGRVDTRSESAVEQDALIIAAAKGDLPRGAADKLARLAEIGYLRKNGEAYTPAFWVTFGNKVPSLTAEQQRELDRLKSEAADIAETHWDFCVNEIRNETPDFLRDGAHKIYEAAGNILLGGIRGEALAEALRVGWLKYDPAADHRMYGAYLEL
jgi:RNA polymerase sigma factor (sigma-70 family)